MLLDPLAGSAVGDAYAEDKLPAEVPRVTTEGKVSHVRTLDLS